jgi:hypothetical protein
LKVSKKNPVLFPFVTMGFGRSSGLFPFYGTRRTAEPPQSVRIPKSHNPRQDPYAPTGSGVIPGRPASGARGDPRYAHGHQGSRRVGEPPINIALTITMRNHRNPTIPVQTQFAPRTPAVIGKRFKVDKAFANESGVHQLLSFPAMNFHLRSEWGRREYGSHNTPEKLLNDWTLFGFQLSDEKINNQESRGTSSKAFCLQGPLECPNGWLSSGQQMYVGDRLLLLLVRMKFRPDSMPETHTSQIGLDASLSADGSDDPEQSGSDEYMWQLVPFVLHAGLTLDPCYYSNAYAKNMKERYMGMYFVMGKIRAMDAPDDFMRDHFRARQCVFPVVFNDEVIDKYLKLPLVKLDVMADPQV